MKKLMITLCAGVLVSVLCAGFVACDKPESRVIELDPDANCWVFTKTTPRGEEIILLAKRGLSWEEGHVIFDDFESEYGKGNIRMCINYPGGINNFELNRFEIKPDAISNCYELTMTIDFSNVGVPSIENLFEYQGVRIDGNIAICKNYIWAYTDEGAYKCLKWYEESYNSEREQYLNGDFYDGDFRRYGGSIIGTSTIKNLGSEVHDMPITF